MLFPYSAFINFVFVCLFVCFVVVVVAVGVGGWDRGRGQSLHIAVQFIELNMMVPFLYFK